MLTQRLLSSFGSKCRHLNTTLTDRLNRRWEVSSERKTHFEKEKSKADLDKAVRLQDANWIKGLLEKGARPESKDFMRVMDLVQVTNTHKSPKIVALFLDSVNVKEAVDGFNRNPLHVVEHPEIAKLLIATGEIQINAKDDSGQSPLFKAVRGNHLGVIKELLAAGADLETRDKQGATPLHYAESKEAALLLLEAGIKVDACDQEGKTPLLYALTKCYDGNCSYALVETYLAKGANIESVNSDGRTPLFYTMYGVHFAKKIATLLLQNKANINHQDLDGETPLLHAVRRRREEAVKFFLKSGANTDIVDNEGKGVMDIAVSTEHLGPWTYPRSTEIACILASHGVRPPLPQKFPSIHPFGFNISSP